MTANRVIRHSSLGSLFGMLLVALSFSSVWAMHEQVRCQSCHELNAHAKDGVSKELRVPKNEICFSCHDAEQDISGLSPPYVMNGRTDLAGGSFTATLDSDDAGHNMLTVDATLDLTPPGGLSVTAFNCLSCHDPHTNGNYRNLKKEINGQVTLIRAEGGLHFDKNLYISGINNFCSACHQKFADGPATGSGGAWRRHPVGISIYGSRHADYNHWARLADKITLAEFPSGNPNDPSGAQVFCLSCHFAHAGPYRNALRWDYAKTTQGCLECHSFE
jgi:predicted CXXCH cytochrome family protein